MLGVISLVVGYVFIALLLLILNLYSNWGWRLKATMICLVTFFYIASYLSFPPIMGWPTKNSLPAEFRLIASYVLEPNKKTGENGQIFLWATDLAKNPKTTRPRAFVLPYSDTLSEKITSASEKIKKGKPQVGELQENQKESFAASEGLSRKKPKVIAINFFDLPNPTIPSK